jgi:hypothetical protein
MDNVFQVLKVNPNDNTRVTGMVDLYDKNYTSVTVKEVAQSNKWYSTMPTDPARGYYQNNLKLTYDYFENNVEARLLSKCHETYSEYTTSEQHYKMERHRFASGLCFFGPRSVSATQNGSAICVVAVLCQCDSIIQPSVFLSVTHRI